MEWVKDSNDEYLIEIGDNLRFSVWQNKYYGEMPWEGAVDHRARIGWDEVVFVRDAETAEQAQSELVNKYIELVANWQVIVEKFKEAQAA